MVCHGELVRHRPPREPPDRILPGDVVRRSPGRALQRDRRAGRLRPSRRVSSGSRAGMPILPKTRDDSIASSRGHCLLDWALPVTLGSIAWGLITFLQGPYQSQAGRSPRHARLGRVPR